jgi:hypothetical protein
LKARSMNARLPPAPRAAVGCSRDWPTGVFVQYIGID